MTVAERIAKWAPFGFLQRSVENPETPISDPGQWLLDHFSSPTASGVNVTEFTALNLTSVWRAVNLTSNVIASLPLKVFEKTESGRRELPDHPVAQLLRSPNPFMTKYDFNRVEVSNESLWGNGIGWIRFNNRTARPESIMPVEPWRVSSRIIDGKLFYSINTNEGRETVEQANILHYKGFSFNGLWGRSPIRIMNDAVGGALAAQAFGSKFFGDGANMGGFLSTEGKLSDKAIERLRKGFKDWKSITNALKPQILEEGLKYQRIGIPPEDAQFLGTRKFHVTEVARMYDVPPPLMYDLERATFANVEKLILAYVKFDLSPRIRKMEEEMNRKLLMESEKGRIFIAFNMEGLLRGDEKARSEFYQKLFGIGAIDSNEIRAKENMNDYDGGNKKFVPLNFQRNDGDTLPTEQNMLSNLKKKLETEPTQNGTH